MKAKKRYFLLFFVIFIFFLYHSTFYQHGDSKRSTNKTNLPFNISFYTQNRTDYYSSTIFHDKIIKNTQFPHVGTDTKCRMETCFDFSRCSISSSDQNIKIHLYPIHEKQIVNPTFLKIYNFIRTSKYYEPNPNKGSLCFLFCSE